MKRSTRAVLASIILLTLGMLANLGIAWFFVLVPPRTVSALMLDITPLDGAWVAQWPAPVPPHWPTPQLWGDLEQNAGFDRRMYRAPEFEYSGLHVSVRLELSAAGWPMRSFTSLWWRECRGMRPAPRLMVQQAVHEGPEGLWRSGIALDPALRLPLMPAWPGFVVNTLLYAATAASVCYGPGVFRRAMRRRCRLCMTCGYSRDGIASDHPCPECGTAASRRPAPWS